MQKLKGKKVLMIIASNNFRDEEYRYPRNIFEKEGDVVAIGSSSLNISNGVKGTEKVKPDILIKDILVSDYDAVIFIGGGGCREYFNNHIAHKIANDTVLSGKILASICSAGGILANAGVLKGKKATVFPSEVDLIKNKGAIYTGAAVEQDGKIITANGPEAANEFGTKIAKALMRESVKA